MKKISVIIPVYNIENYIEKCIQSVLSQTLNDIEIIVINDGTLDNSMKKIEKYRDKLIIINQENQGLSAARNTGLKYATGEYVFFLDSDDWIKDTYLEKFYKKTNNSDVVFSDYIYYNESNGMKKMTNFSKERGIEEIGKYFMISGAEIVVWNKLYKREFLVNNNIYFLNGIIHEDEEFSFKIYMLAKKITYLEENAGYFYRINRSGSIMTDYRVKKGIFSLEKIIESLFEFYKNIDDNFIKARTLLKIIDIYNKKKELELEKFNFSEIRGYEEKYRELLKKEKFSKKEIRILKKDFKRFILSNNLEEVKIFDFFYWKTRMYSFGIIKKLLKRKILKG